MVDESLIFDVKILTPFKDISVSIEIKPHISVLDFVKILRKRYKIKDNTYELFYIPNSPNEKPRILLQSSTLYEQAVFNGSKLEFRSNLMSYCIYFPDSTIKLVDLNSLDSVHENIDYICSIYHITPRFYELSLKNGIILDRSSSFLSQEIYNDTDLYLKFCIGSLNSKTLSTSSEFASSADLHFAFHEHQNAILSSSLLVPDQSVHTLAVISLSLILTNQDIKNYNELVIDDNILKKIYSNNILSNNNSEKNSKNVVKHLRSNLITQLPNFRSSIQHLKKNYIEICSESEWYKYQFYNCFQRINSKLVHALVGVHNSSLVIAEGNPYNFTFISLSKMTHFHLLEYTVSISIAGNDNPYIFTSDSAVSLWFSLLKYFRGSPDSISFKINSDTPKPVLYQMNLIGSSFLIGQLRQKMIDIRCKMDSPLYFIRDVCIILDDMHIYLKQIRQENYQFKSDTYMKSEFFNFFLKFYAKLDQLDRECSVYKNVNGMIKILLSVLYTFVNLTEKISQSIHGGSTVHVDLLDNFQSIIRELNFFCDTVSVVDDMLESPNLKKALHSLKGYVINTIKKMSVIHLSEQEQKFSEFILEFLDIHLKSFDYLMSSFWTQTIVSSQLEESKIQNLIGELDNLKCMWSLLRSEIIKDLPCFLETDLISSKLMQFNLLKETVQSQLKEIKIVLAELGTNPLLKLEYGKIKHVVKDINLTISSFEHLIQILLTSKQLLNIYLNENYCNCFYDTRALKSNTDANSTFKLVNSVINSCFNFLHKVEICCNMTLNDAVLECPLLLKDPIMYNQDDIQSYQYPESWDTWPANIKINFSQIVVILKLMNAKLDAYTGNEMLFNYKSLASALEFELRNLMFQLIDQDSPKYQVYFDSLIAILYPVTEIFFDLIKAGSEQPSTLLRYRRGVQKNLLKILENALREDKTKEILTIRSLIKQVWNVVQQILAPTNELHKTLNYKITKLESCFEFYDPLISASETILLGRCIRDEYNNLSQVVSAYKFQTAINSNVSAQPCTDDLLKLFKNIRSTATKMCKYFGGLISDGELHDCAKNMSSFVSSALAGIDNCCQDTRQCVEQVAERVLEVLERWIQVFSPTYSANEHWSLLKQTVLLCVTVDSSDVLNKFRNFERVSRDSYGAFFEYVKDFVHTPTCRPHRRSLEDCNVVQPLLDFISTVKTLDFTADYLTFVQPLFERTVDLAAVAAQLVDVQIRQDLGVDYLTYTYICNNINQLIESVMPHEHYKVFLSRMDEACVRIINFMPQTIFTAQTVEYFDSRVFQICTEPAFKSVNSSSSDIMSDIGAQLNSIIMLPPSIGKVTIGFLNIFQSLQRIAYYTQKIIVNPDDYLHYFHALHETLRKIEKERLHSNSTSQQCYMATLESLVKELSSRLKVMETAELFDELHETFEQLTQRLEWDDMPLNNDPSLQSLIRHLQRRLVWIQNQIASTQPASSELNHSVYALLGHLVEYYSAYYRNPLEFTASSKLWLAIEIASQFSSPTQSQQYLSWISLICQFIKSKFQMASDLERLAEQPDTESSSFIDYEELKSNIAMSLSKVKNFFDSMCGYDREKVISTLILSEYQSVFDRLLEDLIAYVKGKGLAFTDQRKSISFVCKFLIQVTSYFASLLCKDSKFYIENSVSLMSTVSDFQEYYLKDKVIEQVVLINEILEDSKEGHPGPSIIGKTKKETWQNICRLSSQLIESIYMIVQTLPDVARFKVHLTQLNEYMASFMQVFDECAQTRKVSERVLSELNDLQRQMVTKYVALLQAVKRCCSIDNSSVTECSTQLSNIFNTIKSSLAAFHSILIDPYHSFNLELSEIASCLDGVMVSFESGIFSSIPINTNWDYTVCELALDSLENFKKHMDVINMDDDYSFHKCIKSSIEQLKNFWHQFQILLGYSQVVPAIQTNSVLHLIRRVITSIQKFIVSSELLILDQIRQKTLNLIASILKYKEQIHYMWTFVSESVERMKSLKQKSLPQDGSLVPERSVNLNALLDIAYNSCSQFEMLWEQSYFAPNVNDYSFSYHEFENQVEVFKSTRKALQDLLSAVCLLIEVAPDILTTILKDQERFESEKYYGKHLQQQLAQLIDETISFVNSISLAKNNVLKEFRKLRNCISSILKLLNQMASPACYTGESYKSPSIKLIQDVRIASVNSFREAEGVLNELRISTPNQNVLDELQNHVVQAKVSIISLIKIGFELQKSPEKYANFVKSGSGGEIQKFDAAAIMNQIADSEDSSHSATSSREVELIDKTVVSGGGEQYLSLAANQILEQQRQDGSDENFLSQYVAQQSEIQQPGYDEIAPSSKNSDQEKSYAENPSKSTPLNEALLEKIKRSVLTSNTTDSLSLNNHSSMHNSLSSESVVTDANLETENTKVASGDDSAYQPNSRDELVAKDEVTVNSTDQDYDSQIENLAGYESSEPYFIRLFIFNTCYLALSTSLFINQYANSLNNKKPFNFFNAAHSIANAALTKLRKSCQMSPQETIIEADSHLDNLAGSMNSILNTSSKVMQMMSMSSYMSEKKNGFEKLNEEINSKSIEIDQRALVLKLEKSLSFQKLKLNQLSSVES